MADDVDEALEETFPASDPPANTVETGIGVNGDPLSEGTATEDTETTDSTQSNGAAEKGSGVQRATGPRSGPR